MKMRCWVIAAALCIAACGLGRGAVVAEVDGQKIYAGDLKNEMLMERSVYDAAILTTRANLEAFRRQALERLVQERVMLSEAERLGIKADSAEPAENQAEKSILTQHGIDPDVWRRAQERRAIIAQLIDREVMSKIPIEEENVTAYYSKNAQEFRENTTYHARQILVDTREEAEEVRAKLAKGEDFGELAKKHSLSPDGERGGDLGYFDSKAYPEVFAEICARLKPGEISDVIGTPYGFQIFMLIDSRPARQRPFEEVADSIRRRLREERVEEFYRPWIEGLMAKSKVEIKEDALKEVRLES